MDISPFRKAFDQKLKALDNADIRNGKKVSRCKIRNPRLQNFI